MCNSSTRVTDAGHLSGHMPPRTMCRLTGCCCLGVFKSTGPAELSKYDIDEKSFREQIKHEKVVAAELAKADKICVGCGKTQPITQFPSNKWSADKLSSACTICVEGAEGNMQPEQPTKVMNMLFTKLQVSSVCTEQSQACQELMASLPSSCQKV